MTKWWVGVSHFLISVITAVLLAYAFYYMSKTDLLISVGAGVLCFFTVYILVSKLSKTGSD
ncbi:MAG: hypothetical protein NT157_04295 [Candidatus Micrarchaeota archaeon]|nr:hypothetical protein [Candidatus Micrarchaeota archaeon]